MNGLDVLFYAIDDRVICKITVKQHIMMKVMESLISKLPFGIVTLVGSKDQDMLISIASKLADGIIKEGSK